MRFIRQVVMVNGQWTNLEYIFHSHHITYNNNQVFFTIKWWLPYNQYLITQSTLCKIEEECIFFRAIYILRVLSKIGKKVLWILLVSENNNNKIWSCFGNSLLWYYNFWMPTWLTTMRNENIWLWLKFNMLFLCSIDTSIYYFKLQLW